MVKAMAPNAPIGAARIRMCTSLNTGATSDSSSASTGLALLADQGQRQAEQHRDEQHLQDVVADERAEQRLRNDVHREADQAQLMRFLHVALHGGLVQFRRVDVHAGARLHHVARPPGR